jgi:hypothetical protein
MKALLFTSRAIRTVGQEFRASQLEQLTDLMAGLPGY